MLSPQVDKLRPHPSIMAGLTPSMAPSGPRSMELRRSPDAKSQDSPDVANDVDMSLPVSSEDEADEDDFDEDDYLASEAKHEKERKTLEARKPPPLLQDVVVRNLLIRLQLLNMIEHDAVIATKVDHTTAALTQLADQPPQAGLPSPEEVPEEEDKTEIKQPQPRGRPLRQPPVNPIPTPPVEELPYLVKLESRPAVFEDSDDDEIKHEAMATLLNQRFENEAFEWRDDLQDMHHDFSARYFQWKQEQESKRPDINMLEVHASPAPASPAPSAAPSVTPSIAHERTRGGRNTTEADLQAAIALSQQTMKEEEERREREAQSSGIPNYEHEATVPAMLPPAEEELSHFEDTNHLIPLDMSLDIFDYVPPEDDFDEMEQLAFIQAYCQTPKKWGKIAEVLPGRSYQDCITHYYLTKGDAKYKEIWRRSQPKRRRGRASTKPRSTALMSELAYRDGEEGNVAVTDTGRPRRAAAPTFGDTPGEPDPNGAAPPAKRLAVSKEAPPEGVTKPTRGRKAGTGTKTRRTKAQIEADRQAQAAAQAVQNVPRAITFAPQPLDASPQRLVVAKDRTKPLLQPAETNMLKPNLMPNMEPHKIPDHELPPYHSAEAERQVSVMATHTPNQPTSYWSVPEQQKFPQLIAYYGRDFATIADFMKTKTSTMVSFPAAALISC
jgi:hypothetical protein